MSIENLAEEYIKKDETGICQTSTYMKGTKGSSAGGGYSTAEDSFKFAKAFKNNTLISAENLKLMVSDENQYSYGYEFSLNECNDIEVYGHKGGAHGVSAELDIYKERLAVRPLPIKRKMISKDHSNLCIAKQ